MKLAYGYKITDGVIQPDPLKSKIVKTIFSDYNSGKSPGKIAAALNAVNHSVATGKEKCHHQYIRYILQNAAYAGTKVYPPIIDKTTYDTAMALYSEKSTGPVTSKELSGKLICGRCGGTFQYHRQLKDGSNVWMCSGRRRKEGKCTAGPIKERRLLKTFEILAREIQADSQILSHRPAAPQQKKSPLYVSLDQKIKKALKNGDTQNLEETLEWLILRAQEAYNSLVIDDFQEITQELLIDFNGSLKLSKLLAHTTNKVIIHKEQAIFHFHNGVEITRDLTETP